jgi:hypothetical protein
MRFTSSSRRALGLLAVSTIGMSTAVLGVTGIASAAPASGTLAVGQTVTDRDVDTLTIGAGVCSVDWQVTGGEGGAASDGTAGQVGGYLRITTDVHAGDVFTLHGGDGGDNGTVLGGGDGAAMAQSQLAGQPGEDHHASGGGAVDGGGGGGGSASSVDGDGYRLLGAFGGVGGGTTGAAGGDGGLGTANFVNYSRTPTVDGPAPVGAAAGVSATGIACVSEAPYLDVIEPGDGALTLDIVAPPNSDGVVVTGYEVTIDGGGSWTPLTTTTEDGRTSGTVSGLVNDRAYDVGVRAVSGSDQATKGRPSQFRSATPYRTLPAPTITSVTTSPSRVTISWTAPAGVVKGYDVGWSTGQMGNGGCAITDPTVTTCSFTVPAGSGYVVGVRAIDMQDRAGTYAFREGVTVPGPAVPAAVPTQDDGDITGPAGAISSLAAGQKVTLQGSGYAPNSTVQLTVFSSPVSLGTVVTDQNGAFSVEVTVPADLANGTHHLVATGIDAAGNVRNLVITVTVSGGVATLATTGFDAVPVAVGGALVLLVGGGLLVGARRRTDA